MSDLILFDYAGSEIRTVKIDGEAWFVASDVCSVLGITNVGNVLARLDEADIHTTDVWSESNNSRYTVKRALPEAVSS